jgi:hypothetical protein
MMRVLFKELEVEIEVLERMVLDRFGDIAQRLEFREPLDGQPTALRKPILSETSGYLTQNVPPKPQHISAPEALSA